MQRRNISNEAGGRADGLLMVSVLFITAFTYIALTTSPVYTGIGVDDRAPVLDGQVYDGTSWTDFSLYENVDSMWVEGEGGTYYMIEFMDTNCSACENAAKDFPDMQDKWLGEDAARSMQANRFHFGMKILLGKNMGETKSKNSVPHTSTNSCIWTTKTTQTRMVGVTLVLRHISL